MEIPDPKFEIGEIVRTVSPHRDYNNKLVKIVDMAYQRGGLNNDKEWGWEYRVEDGPLRPCLGEHTLKKES